MSALDARILIGYPVHPDPRIEKLEAELGCSLPTPHQDSVVHTCLSCLQPVWLGPGQNEILAHFLAIPVYCPVCGVRQARLAAGPLGNITVIKLNPQDGPRVPRQRHG